LKKYIYVLSALAALVLLAACYTWLGWGEEFFAGQSTRPAATPAPQGPDRVLMPPVHAPAQTIVLTVPPNFVDLTGKGFNPLTGLYICEEAAKRRPFAVVMGNSAESLPQSGISQADIIYEVISEGVVTRLIGIFQDFDTGKIGSVRSARHYFIDIALDHDAFFVHFGGSPLTFQALRDLRINNINGIQLDGGVRRDNFDSVVFWRDADRWSRAGMREHSAYTSAANLIRQAERANYRLEKNDAAAGPFAFYNSPQSPPGADEAGKISVTFVANTPVIFEYDAETRKYNRYQGSGARAQIDEETGLQLAVDNVIVQLTTVRAIQGDSEGRRNVAVVGSGEGYLFTNGTVTPLLWSKASSAEPTVWTCVNGEKLTLNKGSTWICITNREPVAE